MKRYIAADETYRRSYDIPGDFLHTFTNYLDNMSGSDTVTYQVTPKPGNRYQVDCMLTYNVEFHVNNFLYQRDRLKNIQVSNDNVIRIR